ncbi:MAG: hypothetical protein HOO97_02025 [Sideroxydans sp.]|nr:hypothetical protein [Sideroxydans sp.]
MSIDPMSAITGLSTLAKAAIDIASSNDAAQRNALLIEFQKALIQTQGFTASEQIKNASLVSRNQELEQEIVRLKNWETERGKYELKEIARGVFARIDKGYVGQLQSAHKFCATCFEKGIKSPLQQQSAEMRQIGLHCFSCKSHIIFRIYSDVS